jgi:hypothetical protein
MAASVEPSFVAQAAAAFHFLVSEYGFAEATVRGPRVRVPAMVGDDFEEVRFESKRVFVSIWRCPSRLEWDVEVGLLRQQPDQEEAFSLLSDLGALLGRGAEEGEVNPMWPDQLLPRALKERAQFLKEHGEPALVGDVAFFGRASSARSTRTRAYWHSKRVDDATRNAADAFRRKDWRKVVRLLDPVSGDLSPAQRRKLEYARKRGRPTDLSLPQP